MDSHDLLTDLDADQRRAVTTESRLVAVIAGAGSGKTRVLTRRIAYRIATDTADARYTLALTFTAACWRIAATSSTYRSRRTHRSWNVPLGCWSSFVNDGPTKADRCQQSSMIDRVSSPLRSTRRTKILMTSSQRCRLALAALLLTPTRRWRDLDGNPLEGCPHHRGVGCV